MFEELIKKIMVMLDSSEHNDPFRRLIFQAGYYTARSDAIDIINASEPPELDAPDCEGWWWYKESDRMFPCYIKDGIIQDFIHPLTFSLDKYLKSYKGKWIRAIMPKEAK